ncbi:(Fe-S)-binding protein [Desulfosporosinus sp. BICA1-9]|uniref:(Fe-S)-binding protein n=1 Tax=Desulfosporosinus sp. BICA1-9 TaxID=1531958 RepID=UPI00054B8A79|nr:(Fe-S)-binding protein [Desulfosporosinus sp. BICA1-9]KJS49094.1 MAG: hypothetical protein VR66_10555 [Peptococcaceae bacterium BRH_c23]KJS89795.1 MAG: hypothetical protein JL57_05300 [Desulfosporosinus sp. BICA1-9]HBW36667.1 (Fe-S)-binding protein [Desulfosporosinus sp.]
MKPLHEFTEELYRCIRCGSCTAVCPIFSVEKREMSVARGRLRLVREHLAGNLDLTPKMRDYLDLCLGCRACVVSCPPQVPTDKIIRAARAHFAIKKGQPLVRHILLKNVLVKPKHFTLVLDSLKLARRTGVNRLLPKTLKTKEDILPQLPKNTFRELLKGIELKKSDKKVGFFLSCMDNNVYPQVLRAAINILEKLDYEVVIPTKVVCCGAAHDNYGDVENARKLAWQNIEAFSATGVDVILTDCATCGSTMQSYGELFQGKSEEAEALSFVSKVMDINQFLSDKLPSVSECAETTVTYHDPCHLVRYQNVREAPRKVLESAGVNFKEMAEADRCCGGGGTFNIFHYDISMKILDRKIENVKQTGASVLATSCPACRIQLEHGIKRHGLTIEVLHPIEVLEKSYLKEGGVPKIEIR